MRSVAAAFAALLLASLASAAPVSCGARQYLDGSVCKQCPISTMSCTSATVAVTCARGRYLTADKQCVLASACPQNTFADSSKGACTKCFVKDAATCKDATTTGTTSCMIGCLSGFSCPPAARLAGGMYCANHVATPCPGTHVQKCDASGVTTACATDYHLTGDNTCVKCIGSQRWDSNARACTLVCSAGSVTTNPDGSIVSTRGTYPDTTSGTCKKCGDLGAETCDASGVSITCLTDAGYHMNIDNHCQKCADGETFNTVSKSCKANVVTCLNAHYITIGYSTPDFSMYPPGFPIPDELKQPQPIQQAQPATYLDSNTKQCVTCPNAPPLCDPTSCVGKGVYSCDSTGKTTLCYNSYLYDGICTDNCYGNPGGIAHGVGTPADAVGQPFAWFGVCEGHY